MNWGRGEKHGSPYYWIGLGSTFLSYWPGEAGLLDTRSIAIETPTRFWSFTWVYGGGRKQPKETLL